MPDDSVPDVYAAPKDPAAAPRALYVHVPFCLHRCGYCDFTLVAQKDELIPAYLAALANELSRVDDCCEVDTIFVGGGTPTHLSAVQLSELFSLINRHFRLVPDGEYSIEANPDGVDDQRLQTLVDHGVNRLSLGVQSFDDIVLKTLERQHSRLEAIDVVERAAQLFPNISLDLIFGVPGQSLDRWNESLRIAADLPLNHVSTYGLTFEKGTDFFQRVQKGGMHSVPDDLERDMYASAMETLSAAGFQHYEISNFARHGGQCRHNVTYWAANEYFAFGPGGARYVNGIRSTNARNVARWIKSWQLNQPALQEWERLSDDERIREAIFLGLRKVQGISVNSFRERFGISPVDVEPEATRSHVAHGLLEITDGFFRLTDEGRFVADTVITDFL